MDAAGTNYCNCLFSAGNFTQVAAITALQDNTMLVARCIIQGTVRQVRWQSPHSTLIVELPKNLEVPPFRQLSASELGGILNSD